MQQDEAGPLLEVVLAAQQRHDDYAQPETLMVAAERLVEYARDAGRPRLVAASPLAERVVGAAVAIAGGDLEGTPVYNGDGEGEVLVVDVAVASALPIQALATQLRTTGARNVRGVALDPIGSADGWFSASDADGVELLPV